MGIKIKWETAENMMNIVAFTACKGFIENDEKIDLEAIQQFARDTFEEYCKATGITEVEEPEDSDEDDFDSDFDDDENKYCDSAADCYFCNSDDEDEESEEVDDFGVPMDYWSEFDEDNDDDENTEHDDSPNVKDEFIQWYMQDGYTFEETCRVADILFGEGE